MNIIDAYNIPSRETKLDNDFTAEIVCLVLLAYLVSLNLDLVAVLIISSSKQRIIKHKCPIKLHKFAT